MHLNTSEYIWVHLNGPEYFCILLNTFRYFSVSGSFGYIWIHLDTSGYIWIHFNTQKFTSKNYLGSKNYTWLSNFPFVIQKYLWNTSTRLSLRCLNYTIAWAPPPSVAPPKPPFVAQLSNVPLPTDYRERQERRFTVVDIAH